jgi:hypothetical protein
MAANPSGAGGGLPPNAGQQAGQQAAQAAQQAAGAYSGGLKKLTAQWGDFADALVAPAITLAAGGSKVQAAWSGVRAVLEAKVLGPLGLVTGASAGLLLVTRRLIAEWRTMGVQSAKAIETLTLQFKPLLGSMELAKQRAREIFDFSVKTPFKFPDLAEGNKILQSLTRGALASKDGMTLVGDAASVAGADFADTARQVGRLYDGLMSGRPVGEAAFRLQELGLISGQTRTQIEAMQAANAAGSAVWAVAQKDLERAKGAMEVLSQSVAGLESTFEDTRQQLEAGFGQGFMEGEKAAIRSATAAMEAMTPVAEVLGRNLGQLDTWWEQLKSKLVGVATGSKVFTSAITGAGLAVVGFSAAVLLAAGTHLLRFLAGVRSVAAGQAALTAATMAATGAQTVAGLVGTQLASAYAALVTALKAVAAGSYLSAAANLKVAAAETIAAFRTNALAASQVVLKGAFLLARTAALVLAGTLRAVAAAMVLTPIGAFSTALVVAGGALLSFYTSMKKAREELAAYAASAQAVVENMDAQARAIRTVADLQRAEADIVRELTQAYLELEQAKAGGDEKRAEIARRKIDELLATQRKVRGLSGSTELSEEQMAREDARKELAKEARKARDEDEAGRGAASAVAVARRQMEESEAKRQAARLAEEEEKRVEQAKAALRRRMEDEAKREEALRSRQAALKGEILERQAVARSTAVGGPGDQSGAAWKATLAADEAKKLQTALDEVERALGNIEEARRANAEQEARVALESASELAVLNEKLAIYARMEGAVQAVADQRKRLGEAEKNESLNAGKRAEAVEQAQAALRQAMEEQSRAEALAAATGVKGWRAIDQQNNQRRVQEIKTEREDDLSPVKREEEARRLRDAELALAQGRVETESRIADLRLKGYEREAAMLEFAKRDLSLRYQRKRIDDDGYAKERAILAEREAALKREADKTRAELNGALTMGNLRRREEAARSAGRVEEAEALRKQAEAAEDAATRRDAIAEAEGLPESERAAYVARRMEEERAAREQALDQSETERELRRQQADAERGMAAAEVKARAAEIGGSGREARRVREDAARKQDEAARAQAMQGYRDMGYGDKQADAMANEDVKRAQAQRIIEQMQGYKGSVIASSLAQVGGGGGVAGTDPSVALQEKMVELLKDIADASKDNVDRVW